MPKGKEALVSFFGIVYAGGFYTFLDPELPEARFKIMAEVLKPAVIFTDNTHAAMAEEYFPEMRCLRVEKLTQTPEHTGYLEKIRQQQLDVDPLYVNFTSGSTGTPKGVVVSHRSVVDFIDVFARTFRIDSSPLILMCR